MTTILVVDDHDDIRDLIDRRLRQQGFAVITARNGLEAVVAAANTRPAAILMDVNMPELDGLEATSQIRQNSEHGHIPVIALTAYALPGDESRAMSAGCDAYQSKPIDFDKLIEQVNELILTASKNAHPNEQG